MNTDLTKVSDHPVAILRKAAQAAHDRQNAPVTAAAFEAAAKTLTDHEQESGVIFAALDNEALASVAEAYHALHNADSADSWQAAATSLADAVRDMLGLDD